MKEHENQKAIMKYVHIMNKKAQEVAVEMEQDCSLSGQDTVIAIALATRQINLSSLISIARSIEGSEGIVEAYRIKSVIIKQLAEIDIAEKVDEAMKAENKISKA